MHNNCDNHEIVIISLAIIIPRKSVIMTPIAKKDAVSIQQIKRYQDQPIGAHRSTLYKQYTENRMIEEDTVRLMGLTFDLC